MTASVSPERTRTTTCPGGVPGCGLEPHPILDGVFAVNELRLARVENRQYAVPEVIAGARQSVFLRLAVPVFPVGARKQVFCVGERRYPAAVTEPGVPADVVDVHVCAQHVVDIFGCRPRRRQGLQPGPIAAMEEGPLAVLVVASAGVHQDGVMAGLEKKALDGDDQKPGGGVVKPGRHPRPLTADGFGG